MGARVSATADLIRLAYEGVIRREAWAEMLALSCRVFKSQDAYYARFPVTAVGPRLVLTHGVDPKVAAAYCDVWAAPPKNPVLTRLCGLSFQGVIDAREVLPNSEFSEFERSEFFDVCRRPRNVDAEFGCGNIGTGGEVKFFAVNRAKGDPAFGDRERKLMSLAYPHLMKALTLEAALGAERSRAAWAARAIETLDDPMIRRDPGGRLCPLNPAGDAFLRSEGVGAWDGDVLLPRDPRPSARGGAPTSPVGVAGIDMSFRSGRTYRLFSTPRFEEDRFVGEVLRLRFVAPGSAPRPSDRKHAFTRQESEVASLLCQGQTSSGICSRLGISVNTLNTHVRHLLEKTECHSRTQLVARLGSPSRDAAGETGA